MTAPAGELSTRETPHTAAGPALRELILGSEGALGVITEVGVRVRPHPQHRRHEAWMMSDFESGCEACRALAQHGVSPDVVRLSDRDETRALARDVGRWRARAARLRGLPPSARARRGLHPDLRLGR